MNRIGALRAVALAAAVVASGCQDQRMVSPTAASLFVSNIDGVWGGPMTLLTATGGECTGGVIPTFLPGNDQGSITIAETVDAVTATMTMESTGLACRYTGTRTAGALNMNATSCDRTGLIVACVGGQARELRLVGSSINAIVDGQQISGRATSTYNVFTPPEGQQIGVGSLVTSHSFSVTRR